MNKSAASENCSDMWPDQRLLKLFNIELPIVQAGMSTYTTPELVAAVSNAGGLGIIGALFREPDEVREEVRRVRELTARPFGVNHVVCQIDPAAVQKARTRSTASASVPSGGVRMHQRLTKSDAKPASGPECSVPATGCAGTR